MHNIYVSNDTLENLGEPIVKGQQLYISGRLRLQRFQRYDNKPRDMYRIQARTIYSCQPYEFTDVMEDDYDGSDQSTLDRNQIWLRAHICFDIDHFDKFSAITLAHHYPRP